MGPREETAPMKSQLSGRILKEFGSVLFSLKLTDTENKLMVARGERIRGDG